MRDQTAKCWNCKKFGHRSAQCPVDTVCFVCHEPGHKKGDAMCNLGVNVDQDSSDDESELGRVEGQSEADLQGHQGTDDEERGGGAKAVRYLDIPQIVRTDVRTNPLTGENQVNTEVLADKVSLPPTSDEDEDFRAPSATNSAAGVEVPPESLRRKVKLVRRSYAEVVSQGESSSSDDDAPEVPFTKVPTRKNKKGKLSKKGKISLKSSKLRQSDITSYTGMSSKRATTETSPDAEAKGSQSPKQRF